MAEVTLKEETDLPSWQLAKEGIRLLINNKQRDAEALFNLHPENIHMNAGYAYAIVTDALMTFEDEKIHMAFQILRDLEKKCSSYSGWIRSVKTKMFGTEPNCSYAEQLESQIILADALVFVATLTFLQQDISGYFKGSWILRKSYKHYQQVYGEVLALYNEIVGDDNVPGGSSKSSSSSSSRWLHSSPSSPKTLRSYVQLNSETSDTCSEKAQTKSEEPPTETTPAVEKKDLTATADPSALDKHATENVVASPDDAQEPCFSETTNEGIPKHQGAVGAAEANEDVTSDENVCKLSIYGGESADAVIKKSTSRTALLDDMEGDLEDYHDDPPVPSPSFPRNGYIPNNFRAPSIALPKQSVSCHANLGTLKSVPSGHNRKSFSPNGFSSKPSRAARNADVQKFSFLKKSSSANSALSAHAETQRRSLSFSSNLSYFTSSFNIFSSSRNLAKEIDKSTICRLLCAVSFGYGLLQLGISLLPPSILKVTSFLGFGGSRRNGLEKLMYARTGPDMRAPFATLALLWYHTIVRPFFALDGNNVQAGVIAAAQLIEETKGEFGQSALFLFFKGRVERLNSDISAAIEAFQLSIENAAQREVKMISMHEVGWCYLIALDYAQSENIFQRLKLSSRWSRPFYSYLAMISAGANSMFQQVEDVLELRNIFQSVPKGTQLDEFLNKRHLVCPTSESNLKATGNLFWKLLVYELLYLWNTLPSCTREDILRIIDDCSAASETNLEPMKGLSKLIEGSCYCILKDFENGISCFQRSVEIRKGLPQNCDTAHVSAFAQYELGLLLVRKEKTKSEGKKLLQATSNYKGYDFEQRLSVRVHAILKNI